YVWGHQKTAPAGQFFTILQNDGNLCTYKGTGPADNKGLLWCSMKTSAVTWAPNGKMIVSGATGAWAGPRIVFGQYFDGANFSDTMGTWLRSGASQRWSFMPDGTVRLSADAGKCLRAETSSGRISTTACDGSAEVTGWSYRASDRSIRKANFPKSCL